MVFLVLFDGGDVHKTSGPHQLLESVITVPPVFEVFICVAAEAFKG